jgi:hypothetical protein
VHARTGANFDRQVKQTLASSKKARSLYIVEDISEPGQRIARDFKLRIIGAASPSPPAPQLRSETGLHTRRRGCDLKIKRSSHQPQLWENVHASEKFVLNLVTYQLQPLFPSEKYLSELSQTTRAREKAYLHIASNIKSRSVL